MNIVKDIMKTDIVAVSPETPIYEALNLLAKHKISGLPVVNKDMNVVGILSEKDVLRLLIDKNNAVNKTVDDYMSRNVVCFKENDSVIDICKFFLGSFVRRVPIIRDNKLIGIVSRRHIVEVILEARSRISDLRYN